MGAVLGAGAVLLGVIITIWAQDDNNKVMLRLSNMPYNDVFGNSYEQKGILALNQMLFQ